MIYSDWIPGPKLWARPGQFRKSGSDPRSSHRHQAPVAIWTFPVGVWAIVTLWTFRWLRQPISPSDRSLRSIRLSFQSVSNVRQRYYTLPSPRQVHLAIIGISKFRHEFIFSFSTQSCQVQRHTDVTYFEHRIALPMQVHLHLSMQRAPRSSNHP